MIEYAKIVSAMAALKYAAMSPVLASAVGVCADSGKPGDVSTRLYYSSHFK